MGAMKNLSSEIEELLYKGISEAEIARLLDCDESLVWEIESLIEDDGFDDEL